MFGKLMHLNANVYFIWAFAGRIFFFNYGTLLSLVTFLGRGVGGIGGGGWLAIWRDHGHVISVCLGRY